MRSNPPLTTTPRRGGTGQAGGRSADAERPPLPRRARSRRMADGGGSLAPGRPLPSPPGAAARGSPVRQRGAPRRAGRTGVSRRCRAGLACEAEVDMTSHGGRAGGRQRRAAAGQKREEKAFLLVDVRTFPVLSEIESDLLFLGGDADSAGPDDIHDLQDDDRHTERVRD